MHLQTQLPATVMGTNVAYCCTLIPLRFRIQVVLVKYHTLWTSESFLVGQHYKYHTSKYNMSDTIRVTSATTFYVCC